LYIDGTANIDSLVADTADINGGTIDGTAIGATTPSTGAFTTLSASGTANIGGGTAYGTGATIKPATDDYGLTLLQSNSNAAGWGLKADTSGNLLFARYGSSAYGTPAISVTLAGAVSMANGLTVTGALSATGAISTSAGNITALNGILQVGSGSKQLYLRTLTGVNRIDSYDNPITATQPLTINSSIMRMAIADTDRAVLDSSGLAVTGALSSTGNVSVLKSTPKLTLTSSEDSDYNTTIENVYTNTAALLVKLRGNTVLSAGGIDGTKIFAPGVGVIGTFTSTGLAVTGALSATGDTVIGPTTSAGRLYVYNVTAGKTALRADGVGASMFIDLNGGGANYFNATSNFMRTAAGTTVAEFSSTGLAVTGSISATYTGAGGGITSLNSDDTSGSIFYAMRSSGGQIGSISRVTTTNAVVYNTTSDGRLKENLRDFTDSGRLIDSLKPRVFDWKNSDENGKNVIGFIAQEQHAADPIFAHIGAVSVGDEDPETITKQWQRSDSALIPILVAELKALRQRVAALENS
jgi:hypothetical protein